jgi:hypothetical protein
MQYGDPDEKSLAPCGGRVVLKLPLRDGDAGGLTPVRADRPPSPVSFGCQGPIW